MRVLIYTMFILSSGTLLAQQGNETLNSTNKAPVTNNNTNVVSPNMELETIEEESIQADSTLVVPASISTKSLERKEIQRKPARGKKYKSSTRIQESPAIQSEPVMDEKVMEDAEMINTQDGSYGNSQSVKAVEMKTVSTNFSSTYSTSDTQRTSRSPSIQQQVQMNQAVDYFEVNAPGSFESHYFKYVAGNYNTELISDLKAAENIRPNNADVHVQLAGYYMIEEDVDSALIYTEKLRESNRLADNVVSYSEDILRSVPESGTLITHGFDDGYGSYYAQNSVGVRQDVTLVSLDFLQSDTYKEELKEKGFELPESDVVDVDYLAEFCSMNVEKNLSISLTMPKEYFQAIQDKLYVVGLVFEYHPESFDNFSRNDFLWNNSMEKDVIANPIDEKGRQLSANYLPMLLHLRKVYQVTGEEKKLKEVDEVSDQVGVQCRKYEQVQKVKSSY
ncbi:MAG: hypothetical protein P8P74_12730 [Crocinitomicaceae bacterium]|nr:hypothetical protein [Crocinitomicaceae bacterium]